VSGPDSPRSEYRYQAPPPSATSTRSTIGIRFCILSLPVDAEHRADVAAHRLLDARDLPRAQRLPFEEAHRGRARDAKDEHLADDGERRQTVGGRRRLPAADARD